MQGKSSHKQKQASCKDWFETLETSWLIVHLTHGFKNKINTYLKKKCIFKHLPQAFHLFGLDVSQK